MSSNTPDPVRFLSREACGELDRRIRTMITGGGDTAVRIQSDWTGEFRWARNRVTVAADRRDDAVGVSRTIDGASGSASTNQTGDPSLLHTVQLAEEALQYLQTGIPFVVKDPPIAHTFLDTHIWSADSYDQPAGARGALVRELITPAERAGMLSAGYLSVAARGTAHLTGEAVQNYYYPQTFAQCSITVRDTTGTASGWAGCSSYDWAHLDPAALAAVALDKCMRSRNPVRIEPGRYTVILEPQALFQLVWPLFDPALNLFERAPQEGVEGRQQTGLFANGTKLVTVDGLPIALGDSRLGQRIMDRRISIAADPAHPELGMLPLADADNPYQPVTWVDHGVLTYLISDRNYALHNWKENEGFPNSGAFKVTFDGPRTSVDEMIASTPRGLLVTRFDTLEMVDLNSVLMSGVTRDGLWLIENGKISKAVKNLRITESPFFVFNRIDQVGEPVPIFHPDSPALIPPMKVHDFSFTSTSDAI